MGSHRKSAYVPRPRERGESPEWLPIFLMRNINDNRAAAG